MKEDLSVELKRIEPKQKRSSTVCLSNYRFVTLRSDVA